MLITMTNGASVRYLSTSGSWYRVEYTHSNGTTYTGYASSTYLTNKTTQTIYTPTVTSNALLGTLTTNSSGSASLVVPAGTVSVKEKTAPKGFSVDNETHTVTMDGNKTLNVSDTPIIMSTISTSQRRVPMSQSQTATVGIASPEQCIKSIIVPARKLHPLPPIRRARVLQT